MRQSSRLSSKRASQAVPQTDDPSKRRKLTQVQAINVQSSRPVTAKKVNLKGAVSTKKEKEDPVGTSCSVPKVDDRKDPTVKVKVELTDAGSKTNLAAKSKQKLKDENQDPVSIENVKVKTESTESISPKKETLDSPGAKDENADDGISDDDLEELDYAKLREQNLRANQEFFASLDIDQAKEMLQMSVAKPKKTATQRGLKLNREPKEILPRRQSQRIRRIDPVGNQLPEPVLVEPEKEDESRLPSGPIDFKDCFYSKNETDAEKHTKLLQSQIMKIKTKGNKDVPVPKGKMADFKAGLDKLTIPENGVAKVVPGRVFSLAWHPCPSPLMAIAGDKYGHVGVWNVDSQDEEHMVTAFRPHTKPVSCLLVQQESNHKLYSCSYDATLRCADFERGVFDDICSAPEADDDLYRNFEFFGGPHTMLVSQFRGNVSLVDIRTPNATPEKVYWVNRKSLRTVSIHPTQQQYFITAGVDANINLWDMRKLSEEKMQKPIQTFTQHSKAIASAYFSPSGHKILSSSADNSILVYSVSSQKPSLEVEIHKRINHNNHTGRWLTNFRPVWHPTEPDVFVTGSMGRPREIEIFDSVAGCRLKSLTNEDYLGSVCSLNVFHPVHPYTLVGANSSGRLHVFSQA